jgi:hypothetical protein
VLLVQRLPFAARKAGIDSISFLFSGLFGQMRWSVGASPVLAGLPTRPVQGSGAILPGPVVSLLKVRSDLLKALSDS